MKKKSIRDMIIEVLKKYFEGIERYDPNFSEQDAIAEICAIVDF